MARTIQGKSHTWQLSDQPIGSGDAGEVYAAACVEQPELTGVVKKPARIATGGTIQRQAGQIAQEALALRRLDGLPKSKAHPPRLLDQALDFTTGTANYFIVSELAPGENLAAMLLQFHQAGKPFPRRVIITVLDALFDLFSRAHRAGVLWNDVKLDHIYWHNPTSQVAVIDWGNAQFLEAENDSQRRTLPRWEDYRQMVDTLGGFLQLNAPELYEDLGWDEFQGAALDLPRVSILARRIAYQQQVIALRVMENQALIRVMLGAEPSQEGLQKIQSYQQVLEQIGAPWEAASILEYSLNLVRSMLSSGDTQGAIRTTTIIWDIFGDSLTLSWHLLREYFRDTGLLSHPSLPELASHTLHENWPEALWVLIGIAREMDVAPWWEHLVPVLRQKASGLVTPSPYQTGQTLLSWYTTQADENQELPKNLRAILSDWRLKGEDLTESPFDYELLTLVRNDAGLPRRIRADLKQNFAAGEEIIRALFQAWVDEDWETLPEILRRMMAWDPDRWGVLRLAEVIEAFQAWLEQLHLGPEQEEDIPAFIGTMLAQIPPVDRLLGSVPWFNSLVNSLKWISEGASISSLMPTVRAYYPWLLPYESLNDLNTQNEALDPARAEITLLHFIRHIKTWSDVDAGLALVQADAPTYYAFCKRLVDSYQSVFALNINLEELETECAAPVHPVLNECCDVLQSLISWRRAIAEKSLDTALGHLENNPAGDWRLLTHTKIETAIWQNEIAPVLQVIPDYGPPPDSIPSTSPHACLATAGLASAELRAQWDQVYASGLHQRLLDGLEETVETARERFFEWRHGLEHSSDPVERLLYYCYLDLIRQISDQLLRLAQHSRKARLGFATLGEKDSVPLSVQLRTAENLLEHLSALEALLIRTASDRRFPGWQEAFQKISAARNNEERRDLTLALSDDHPLYAWLVQSVLAK